MAAANAFRAKSVSFGGTAILGVTDVNTGESGNATDLMTDGSSVVTAIFVDSIAGTVTVTTTDFTRAKAITIGQTGSLVVTYEIRAEGKNAGTGNAVATYANAVVTDNNPQAGTNGNGAATITWRCSAPSAASPVVWS